MKTVAQRELEKEMNDALGSGQESEAETAEERILRVKESMGDFPDVSFSLRAAIAHIDTIFSPQTLDLLLIASLY